MHTYLMGGGRASLAARATSHAFPKGSLTSRWGTEVLLGTRRLFRNQKSHYYNHPPVNLASPPTLNHNFPLSSFYKQLNPLITYYIRSTRNQQICYSGCQPNPQTE